VDFCFVFRKFGIHIFVQKMAFWTRFLYNFLSLFRHFWDSTLKQPMPAFFHNFLIQ
jgi:hypothetical protein